MKNAIVTAAMCVALAGCAGSQVTRTSANTVMIDVGAAPACGSRGAAKVAAKSAAIETIRAGYERYIITGAAARNNVRTIAGPTTAQTYGTYSGGYLNATTYYSTPTFEVGSHDRQLVVMMFNKGDSGFEQAIDARSALGPDWREAVKNGVATCL